MTHTCIGASHREKPTDRVGRDRLVLLATGVGLALRLLLLGSKGFWLDEVRSIQVAQAGFDQWVAGTVEAYHPPFYYMLLTPWLRIARTPFLLRLPSALCGCLGIPLAYALARRLFDRDAAQVSIWLTALCPLLVWYAQELRSYTMLVALSVVALLLLVHLLEKPSLLTWAALTLALASGLYLHYDAMLMLPIQIPVVVGLLASVRARPSGVPLWLSAWAAAFGVFVPWMRTPAMARFLGLLLRNASYMGPLVARVVGIRSALWLPLVLICGLVLLVGTLVGLWFLIRSSGATILRWGSQPWVQVLSVLAYLMLLVLSVLPRGYIVKRHTLVGWIPLLIGFGKLWSGKPRRGTWLGLVCVLSLAASLINIVVVRKPQWREVAGYVLSELRPGDAILLSPGYMGVPFDYYAEGGVPVLHIREGDTAEQLAEMTVVYSRIWYAYHTADLGLHRAATGVWLAQSAELVSTMDFYRVTVELHRITSGEP